MRQRAAYVAMLATLMLQTGCAPAWIQAGMNQQTASGQMRFTYDQWIGAKSTYDNQIQCEKAGARPGGGLPNWTQHWRAIFFAMVNDNWERPDIYLNYIVDQRRAAGLPDLPAELTNAIPPAPANARPPAALTRRAYVYTSGGPPRLICMPPLAASTAP
jgi:hypothetical protein